MMIKNLYFSTKEAKEFAVNDPKAYAGQNIFIYDESGALHRYYLVRSNKNNINYKIEYSGLIPNYEIIINELSDNDVCNTNVKNIHKKFLNDEISIIKLNELKHLLLSMNITNFPYIDEETIMAVECALNCLKEKYTLRVSAMKNAIEHSENGEYLNKELLKYQKIVDMID